VREVLFFEILKAMMLSRGNEASFAPYRAKGAFLLEGQRFRALISVKVQTILDLKRIVGKREVELLVPIGSTVADLLRNMTERWGEALSSRLFEPETHRDFCWKGGRPLPVRTNTL
jgi:hypothetical protein